MVEITPDLQPFAGEPLRLIKLPVPEGSRRQEMEDVSPQPGIAELLTQRKCALPCLNRRIVAAAEALSEREAFQRGQFLIRSAGAPAARGVGASMASRVGRHGGRWVWP